MHCIRSPFIALGILLAACGDRPDQTDNAARESAKPDAGAECPVLTAGDIQAVTGTAVKAVARGSVLGAGGTCGNYVTESGELYLGVNRVSSKGESAASVAAVPQDVYPEKRALAGIGDEAVLFTGPGVRYLVARHADAGW